MFWGWRSCVVRTHYHRRHSSSSLLACTTASVNVSSWDLKPSRTVWIQVIRGRPGGQKTGYKLFWDIIQTPSSQQESNRNEFVIERDQLANNTRHNTPIPHLNRLMGRLSLLPSVGQSNEYQLLGWVIIIINGDSWCRLWKPVQADSQPKSSGLVLGRRPLGAILDSSNEPGELSQ